MEKKVFIAIAGLMCFAAIGGSGNDVAAQESEDVRPLVVMTKMEKTSRGEEANDSDAVTFDRLLFWHLLYSAMDTLMQEDAEARCFIMVMYNKSGVVNAAGIDNERAYEGRDALREMSRPMSLCQMHLPLTLAALSTGKVNEKTVVDVSGGIYEEGDTLLARDHNWHRGGYGSLTTEECVQYHTNVGIIKLLDEAYGSDAESLLRDMKAMRLGMPTSSYGVEMPSLRQNPEEKHHNVALTLGREGQVSPLQMMTFFNGIANKGRMMEPVLEVEERGSLLLMKKMMPQRLLKFAGKALEKRVTYGVNNRYAVKGKKVLAMAGTILTDTKDGKASRAIHTTIAIADGQTYMIVTDVREDLLQHARVYNTDLFKKVVTLGM